MSLLNGIGGTVRAIAGGSAASAPVPAPVVVQPAAPPDFGSLFGQHFGRSFDSVVTSAMHGDFVDPALAARQQAVRARLLAHAHAGAGMVGAPPTADAGTGAASGAAAGAMAAPDAGAGSLDPSLVADQRELADLAVQQAQSSATKVRAALARQFPNADSLPSLASGAIDVATFQPRDAREAKAFAERVTVDMTTGAADLDVVAKRLERAQFEQVHGATAQARAQAAAEVATLGRQQDAGQAFVLKLADVVDRLTGGRLSAAGAAGGTRTQMRGAVTEAIRDGIGRKQLQKLQGIGVAMEQQTTAGHSSLLDTFKQQLFQTYLKTMDARDRADARRRERDEEDKAADNRADQRRAERRSDDERAAARSAARRAESSARSYHRW